MATGPSEAVRGSVLDAAAECFASRGFYGAALPVVADRAGVGLDELLACFPSKEALLDALLAQLLERVDAGPDALHDVEPSRRIIRRAAADRVRTRLLLVLMSEATDPSHPASAYFREGRERLQATFVQAIDASRRRGELAAGIDANRLAEGVIALMDGLQMQWLLNDRIDLVGTFDRELLAIAATIGADEALVARLRSGETGQRDAAAS